MHMASRLRVLVVDDDFEARTILHLLLTANGFDVAVAEDGRAGLRAAYHGHPDAILLDVMMPNLDGFETCRRLRDMTDVPIIFTTARGTMDDIVEGLSAGADDYVVKPFKPEDLLGRLKTCLGQAPRHPAFGNETLSPATAVELDCGRRELVVKDRTVYLNPKEFEVLRLLIRHAGKVLTTDAILNQVWGPERIGEPDLVKQYIYRLRRKIEPIPDAPEYLHTIRGKGYYFDVTPLN
jgi:DNA-binding response OmpR family regulator